MDFDEALKDHFDWKLKFRLAIAQKSTLDVTAISSDDSCELGRWLHGEAGRKYQELTSYSNCVRQHRAFHAEAGKIAAVINDGKYAEAEAMLDSNTPYLEASIATGIAIRELKQECRQHERKQIP